MTRIPEVAKLTPFDEPAELTELRSRGTVVPPFRKPTGLPPGLMPKDFDDCWRFAKVFSLSDIVPKEFRGKAESCMVAIMHGLELGLSPSQSLQSIAIINGRPSVWGDAALAIVRNSGAMESIDEVDNGKAATCTVKRFGEKPLARTFSQEDAARAGLAGKEGPWKQYPARMRQMRARSWALRDCFPDVLKGLYIAEEAQDIPPKDITPPKAQLLEPPPLPPAPEVAPSTQDPPILTKEDLMKDLDERMAVIHDVDTLEEVMTAWVEESEELLPKAERDDISFTLYTKHKKRIGAQT